MISPAKEAKRYGLQLLIFTTACKLLTINKYAGSSMLRELHLNS